MALAERASTQQTPAPEPALDAYADMEAVYGDRGVDLVLRVLDVSIASGVLVACSPLFAAIVLGIRLTSGPPVYYRGARVGRGGEVFQMYKFRTLAADAETRLGPYLGEELTARTLHEVTTLGPALRATHIDELPQFVNVLLGDMSVVGPRPVRPAFLVELTYQIPQYWQRLVVRPGVTGFAQTRISREETWSDKLAHDLEYIADRSVTLYLQVLVSTALRIARRSLAGIVSLARRCG